MSTLSLTLLGPPRVQRADANLGWRLRRELALLAYLAVEQQHSHSRELLAGLLWPDVPEAAARNNLRVTLTNLRRLLGDEGGPFLFADRQHVQFLPTSAHELDVNAFQGLLAASRAHPHDSVTTCDTCVVRLAAAAELYGGDFLAGFSLPDGVPFEEWTTFQREQLRRQQLETLDTLAVAHELRGDYAAQQAYARRQLTLEPWREAAHAQLMRGLWASGQRGAALEQYDLCRRILADELGLEPTPELTALAEQLRSLAGSSVAVGSAPAVARAGTSVAAEKPARTGRTAHNLPAELTSFVGREGELAQLGERFTRPGCRVLTLLGPGGIGKTRLALEVARCHDALFPDGVFLVRLATLTQPDLVGSTIAQVLGVKTSGDQAPEEALGAWLRGKRLLLVLDNFEHLLDAAPLVSDLLAAAPGLTVLATSREALNIAGEQRFLVPPLALPPRDAGPSTADEASAVEQYAAVTLFVQRLQAVRPDFALSAENRTAIAELCVRLDGLPLAIELAAARSQRLSPQHLVEQFRSGAGSLKWLASPLRDRPVRQQTLRATITWSYQLLSEREQALFRRLAVFSGWTAAAAEAVAGSAAELDALLDKSLVTVGEGPGGEPRFGMLEMIREYARERLDEQGELAALREKHAVFFLGLAESAEPYLAGGRDDLHWWAQLRAEEDNLRAALQWALDGGTYDFGLRLVGALWLYWDLSNSYREGRGWLAAMLAAEPSGTAAPRVRAKALNGIAMLALRQADTQAAASFGDASLALYRTDDDMPGLARALLTVGNVAALGQGDFRRATELYAEALALQRHVDNRPGIAVALFNLGLAALSQGDDARARACLEEAQQHYAALESERWVARIKPYLAAAQLLLGEPAGAVSLLSEAVGLWERGVERDLNFVTQLVLVAAGIAVSFGQPWRAAMLLGSLDPLDTRIGASGRRIAAKRRQFEMVETAAREQLGEALFRAAYAAGEGLTLEQTLAAVRVAGSTSTWSPALPAERQQAELDGRLPAALTSLVGREQELTNLAALLVQPGVRMVTLVGMGGIGKTRLALQAARDLAAGFAHGVRLVELAALSDPALVPQAVAAALGLRERADQPLVEALAGELRAQQLLLLLDNCEHLAAACCSLAEGLLTACPGLTILATSREVLHVTGEHVRPVSALAVPGAEAGAPEVLLECESVRLFVERASAASPAFALGPRNAAAVAQICRCLDGIPLALELAAARVRHLTLTEIAARLDDRFELLTSGGSTVVLRQRTLRATLDWSYVLLSPAEQALLRRLAVFAGGCTLESAEAVCALEKGDGRAAVLDLLAQLVDKSLLLVDQRSGTARYRLLETTRAYAHERLTQAGELEMVRDRHHAHFVHLAEEAEPHLFAADLAAWLDRLTLEHDNLRAAFECSMDRGDAVAALGLVSALWSFWYTRGHYEEGRECTLRALALPAAQAPMRARARALNAAGALLWFGRDAVEVSRLLDEALAIGRAIGDPWNTGWALLHKGMIAYQQYDFLAAQPLLQAGLADCRAAGAAGRRGVGWGLIFLGDLALKVGNRCLAREHLQESVALLRELADYALLAYPLRRLGHVALAQGDLATAAAHFTESLRLNRAIDDRLAVAACLAALAAVAAAEARAARDAATQARALRRSKRLCRVVTARLARIGASLWPADAALFQAVLQGDTDFYSPCAHCLTLKQEGVNPT